MDSLKAYGLRPREGSRRNSGDGADDSLQKPSHFLTKRLSGNRWNISLFHFNHDQLAIIWKNGVYLQTVVRWKLDRSLTREGKWHENAFHTFHVGVMEKAVRPAGEKNVLQAVPSRLIPSKDLLPLYSCPFSE